MSNLKNLDLTSKVGQKVNLEISFPVREGGAWKKLSAKDIFENKKVIIFSLPGAFTPTCSSSHLPRYEQLYDSFKQAGVDEVYCVSVNDTFVMNEWAQAQDIHKVKMLPDGNTDFTKSLGMLVSKDSLGFGQRSWRYSAYVENGVIKQHFIEPDVEGDPFEVSDADTMLGYLDSKAKAPKSMVLFTKPGCSFCATAKAALDDAKIQYKQISLSDAVRQEVIRALNASATPSVPLAFVDAVRLDGTEAIVEWAKSEAKKK